MKNETKLSENNFFKKFKCSQLQTNFNKNKNRNNLIKKLYTSSLDKNSLFSLSKGTKSFFKKNKKENSNHFNNSIDINISVNYRNKNLSNQNRTKDYNKIELNKKLSSYSLEQSKNKRNKNNSMNDINNDSHFIQNNLNISLTNLSSPKTNNSYYINPIFIHGKKLNEEKIKKLYSKNKIYSPSYLTKNNNNILIKNKKEFIPINKKNENENIKSYNLLIKTMNDDISKLKKEEKNNSKLNMKIYHIIQNSFQQFANFLQSNNEKEVALNILKEYNKLILNKNLEVEKIKKEYQNLEKKYKELQEKNNSFQNENIQLKKKLEMILERINNNYDSISSEEILNDNLKTNSIDITKSSINNDDLDSIRFFDKINMKRNSFSNTKIPTLNFSGQGQNIKIRQKNNPKLNFKKNDKI